MPSYVTSEIHEGKPTTLRALALRGIALTILGRFLDGAALPERFEPETYHREAADKARARLAEVDAWTPEQAEEEAEKVYRDAVEARERYAREGKAVAQRYAEAIRRVEAWQPPPAVHEYRSTLLAHLRECERFDAHDGSSFPVPVRLPGSLHRDEERASAAKDIIRNEREHAQECERARRRTEFAEALRASLPPEGDPGDAPIV